MLTPVCTGCAVLRSSCTCSARNTASKTYIVFGSAGAVGSGAPVIGSVWLEGEAGALVPGTVIMYIAGCDHSGGRQPAEGELAVFAEFNGLAGVNPPMTYLPPNWASVRCVCLAVAVAMLWVTDSVTAARISSSDWPGSKICT